MSDLISRQAAIDAIKGLPTWWADEGGYYGGAQPPMKALLDPTDAVSAIENLPSAQPKLKLVDITDISEIFEPKFTEEEIQMMQELEAAEIEKAYQLGMEDAQPVDKDTNVPCTDTISRQAAVDGFYEMSSDIDYLCNIGDYVKYLESMPSAQPKIVRCKDCRHMYDNDCPIDWGKSDYDFCSFAEE